MATDRPVSKVERVALPTATRLGALPLLELFLETVRLVRNILGDVVCELTTALESSATLLHEAVDCTLPGRDILALEAKTLGDEKA